VTPLYLLEPETRGPGWAPFGGCRPIAELRAGAFLVRERWERALGLRATEIVGGAAIGFHDPGAPPAVPLYPITGPAWIVSAAFAPALAPIVAPVAPARLLADGLVVGRLLRPGETFGGLDAETAGAIDTIEVDGVPLPAAHTLLDALERLLGPDCAAERDAGPGDALPDGTIVLGERRDVVSRGAAIEPGVVFDVRHGVVVIEAGAEVRSGTRLEGPCWIGAGCRVVGGFIRASAFGPRCVVRGEVATSVFVGYANKAHDGFVGNSVIGYWVNLGAGTTTSNLKNTYGQVRLEVAGARLETGRTFLGTLFGDHAKTAIGTMLSTGTVVGAGASVFGDGGVPKYVAPFAWGYAGDRTLTEDGFLRIAERVLPRRNVAWNEEQRRGLVATYRRLAPR
jgi:hypothetical protein